MNSFSSIYALFFLFSLVLFPIQVVRGGCYSAGVPWGSQANKQRALDSVCEVCESFTSSGFSPGEEKVACVNGMEDTKFDFTLKNESGQSKTITKEQCIDGLHAEINNCRLGGITSKNEWRYRSDPNAGIKVILTYNPIQFYTNL
ncbi:hypothetical protein BY996DRAFT_6413266 [Phakopsora pachyrhizi]|nr:hypothetical protein BY996DRAFT_6413266 [Phakopsora pachyrhizi]